MRIKGAIEGAIASKETIDQDNRDLSEMANLYPNEAGLPMTSGSRRAETLGTMFESRSI
jgi:hypothetical protein